MDWRDIVRTHLPEITGDPARDEDIVEELAGHLSLRFREARHAGASESEAVAIAVAELRRGTHLRQAIVDADRARPVPPPPPPGSVSLLRDVWADCRYAARMLWRHRGFATAALLTMAIGIGMTTAIFSVVQAVLIRPIPLPDADRLVMVWETDRNTGTTREPGSVPDFVDFRERARELDRLAGFVAYEATIQLASGEPTRTAALAVSPEFNALLGIAPIAGRTFSRDEYKPRGAFAVLISERL